MDREPPTSRLPPTEPPVRETHYEDDGGWRAAIADRLDSLRTALVLVGILALVALGLALFALLREDGGSDGAGSERVSNIDGRVEDLESRLENRATEESVADLESSQEQLAERIDAVEESAGDQRQEPVADEEARQAIEDLQQAVEDLSERVEELEQEQAQEPAP